MLVFGFVFFEELRARDGERGAYDGADGFGKGKNQKVGDPPCFVNMRSVSSARRHAAKGKRTV